MYGSNQYLYVTSVTLDGDPQQDRCDVRLSPAGLVNGHQNMDIPKEDTLSSSHEKPAQDAAISSSNDLHDHANDLDASRLGNSTTGSSSTGNNLGSFIFNSNGNSSGSGLGCHDLGVTTEDLGHAENNITSVSNKFGSSANDLGQSSEVKDQWEAVHLRTEDSKVPLSTHWPGNYQKIIRSRTKPLDTWQHFCQHGGTQVVSVLRLPAYLQNELHSDDEKKITEPHMKIPERPELPQLPSGDISGPQTDLESAFQEFPKHLAAPINGDNIWENDQVDSDQEGHGTAEGDLLWESSNESPVNNWVNIDSPGLEEESDLSESDTECSVLRNTDDDSESTPHQIPAYYGSKLNEHDWEFDPEQYGFVYVDKEGTDTKDYYPDNDYENLPSKRLYNLHATQDMEKSYFQPIRTDLESSFCPISGHHYFQPIRMPDINEENDVLFNEPARGQQYPQPITAEDDFNQNNHDEHTDGSTVYDSLDSPFSCQSSPFSIPDQSHSSSSSEPYFSSNSEGFLISSSDPKIPPKYSQKFVSRSGYHWQSPVGRWQDIFLSDDPTGGATWTPESHDHYSRSHDHVQDLEGGVIAGRRRHSSYKDLSPVFTTIPEVDESEGDDDVFSSDNYTRCTQVTSEHGQSLQDVMDTVAMDHKLTSYRVHLASSKALLDLDTDISSLHGNHLIVSDGDNTADIQDVRLALVETLVRRERLYHECLRSIFDVYAEPLRKFSSLSQDDHRVLFFSLEPILSFSTALCLKLNDAIQTWDPGTTRIGNLFSKQLWHHYEEYHQSYPIIRRLLKHKRDTDQEFTQFCRLRHGAARHSLDSLLLLPVQRVPDYNVFLQRLLAATDPTHPDYDDLKKAADKVQMMVREREEELHHVENEHKMDKVQDRFPNDDLQLLDKKNKNTPRRRSTAGAVILKSLGKKHHYGDKNGSTTNQSVGSSDLHDVPCSPLAPGLCRTYILEGPVQLTTACQALDRYLFLFNDLLLVAKQKSSNVFKLKQRVRVCEIWISDCIDDVAESHRPHETSLVIGWPTTNYVATFSSPHLMNIWKDRLLTCVSDEKDKEDSSCIIKIRYVDPSGCLATKSLSVTNTEDTFSVVNRCIEEFHILGQEPQDYQLWATSPNKEEPPYPLFGHENPYSIRKSHEKDWGQEHGDSMMESLRGLDLSYFTLQHAKKKPRDLSLDDPKRAKKVKRSPLHNIFKKNQKPSTVPPSGALFGHPLSEICENNQLPEPIMVLLGVLFMKGPYTIGVFRKPASHKKCQDVKSKLDNRESITTEDITVPVAASLLKDFLLNLPNCLLSSELFDQWVAMTHLTEDTHRIQRINMSKKYIESLCEAHRCLLRHLMCVLYTIVHIQHQDKDQGMDAYGLAVCIAQSMLWPNLANSSNMGEAASKVPAVVQFLIENCIEIFGEDCVKIFGELPAEGKPRQDSSTDSDSVHSMLSSLPEQQFVNTRDNSSLDSLERDCYHTEVDCSPQLAKSHLSPTNLSRDSGLTLSDTQLYEDGTESEHSSIPPRKQSMTRSYSYFEEPLPSADPGHLSSSHDGSLNQVHGSLPVPPPRKTKRRSAGPELDSNPTHKGVVLRNSASANTLSDQNRRAYRNMMSRRISDDSTLGSLDEEYPEELRGLNINQLHDAMDIGTLRKSESGAHLYLNEVDIMMSGSNQPMNTKEHRRSAPPQAYHHQDQSVPTSRQHNRADLQKLGGSLDLQSMPNATIPENQVLSVSSSSRIPADSSQMPLFTLTPPHSPEDPHCDRKSLSDSGVFDQVVPRMAEVESTPPPRPPEPHNYNPHHKPHYAPHSEDHSGRVGKRGKSLPTGGSLDSDRRGRLSRGETIDSTVLRKGMTASGEDKFPAKIALRTSLYSLDEEGLMQAAFLSGDKSLQSQKLYPTSQSSSPSRSSSGACRRSDSYSGVAPSTINHLRQRTIEKSSSDMSVSEQFELSGPVRAMAKSRPNNPPSYEEAIHRQSLLGNNSPREFNLTEQDIVIQQVNSAKAKKLYEESLKKYQTGDQGRVCPPHKDRQPRKEHSGDRKHHHSPASVERVQSKQSPPSYQHACHRAAQLRDHRDHRDHMPSQSSQNHSSPSRRQEAPSRTLPANSAHARLIQSRQRSNSPSNHSTSPARETRQQNKQQVRKEHRRTDSPKHDLPITESPMQSRDSSSRRTDSPVRRMDSPSMREILHKEAPTRVVHQRTESPASQSESPSRATHRQMETRNVQVDSHGKYQIPHSGEPTLAVSRQSPSRDMPTSRSSSFSSREGTPTGQREGTPTRVDHIPRVGSDRARQQQRRERRRSGSRSRERRVGQRYSDPKMSTTKAALITNLNRSKSDSQEHLDKVNKFKTFMAYENNKENFSLEDLSVEDLRKGHRSNRSTPERKPSDERIKLQSDNHHRRRSVPASILKAATEALQNENEPNRHVRRLSIPSVRNKDWHKELAEQYNDYQPPKVKDPPSKVMKFGYVNNKAVADQTDGEKTKRRWVPPVHPTKDLVYVTKEDSAPTRTSTRGGTAVVMRNSSARRTGDDNKSRSQERPSSLMSDDMHKLQDEYNRSKSETRTLNNNKNQDEIIHSAHTQNEEDIQAGINWSVAKLRNLYADDKMQKQKSNQNMRSNSTNRVGANQNNRVSKEANPVFYSPGSQPPAPMSRPHSNAPWHSNKGQQKQHGRPVHERTNPNADEAYI